MQPSFAPAIFPGFAESEGFCLNCFIKLAAQCARLGEQRDSHWYLREARHARYKADATSDPVLRDSYLQVAEAYEKLAEALERPRTPTR